jgi:hypothetical protein
MKRRGFLGLLAALPAMLLPRKAPAAPFARPKADPDWHGITDETVDALREQIRRDLDAEYVGIDVGRPGGDETAVSIWQRGDGKFTDAHAWYLDDVCIGDPVTGCCIAHGSACSNVNVIHTFNRSSNREVTRARIQEALDRIVGVPGL